MNVYSYVMTIVKNSSVAEEITQQTFFKALSKKDQFKNGSEELTWLCAIAKNLSADYFRKNAKQTDLPEDISSNDSFDEKVEDHQLTLQIHIILHKLDEPYKEVFQLRVFGELSFSDIGKIFAKSENWARVTYHRAKLKIQEKLEDNHE